ncbi:hypothetical protein EXIGLDRAFT_608229, partial [Exidia glandulosa HHB12029]
MGLLQLALVVHNVWDTYKILKPPPRPSQRALASRKRAMKSALAVWIVWAAFWLLEPTLDATLGLLMPFYSQAKSFLALGLLVFRSYAAEPIVLHVIRPALKPYVPMIDGILELFSLVGALAASTLLAPVHAAYAWWNA